MKPLGAAIIVASSLFCLVLAQAITHSDTNVLVSGVCLAVLVVGLVTFVTARPPVQ